MRKRRSLVDQRLDAINKEEVSLSAIVLGELRVGIEKFGSAQDEAALRDLIGSFEIVPVDEQVSLRYGELRAHLESIGQRMDNNDLWIAATALVHDAILVTADEAFSRVPGLRTENWRLGE